MSGKRSKRRPVKGPGAQAGRPGRATGAGADDGDRDGHGPPPTIREELLRNATATQQRGTASAGTTPEAIETLLRPLEAITPMDATGPWGWFWDAAPEDGQFSYRDLPPLIPHNVADAEKTSGKDAYFLLEGAAPAAGFGWGSPVVGDPGTLAGSAPKTTAASIRSRAARAGVKTTVHPAILADERASAMVTEPGLIERAGATFVWSPGAEAPWAHKLLQSSSRENPSWGAASGNPGSTASGSSRRITGLLTIYPYVLLAHGSWRVVDVCPVSHLMAIDERLRPVVGAADELPIGINDERLAGDHDRRGLSILLGAQRPVILSALFALACVAHSSRVSVERQGGRCRVAAAGEDAYGPLRSIEISGLRPRLESAAAAGGLKEAMATLGEGHTP